MKYVQIPEELFFALCQWHLTSAEDLEKEEEDQLANDIKSGLEIKLNAMRRRLIYSTYKDKNKPTEIRDAARQYYLDSTGVPPSYRWSSLEPPT